MQPEPPPGTTPGPAPITRQTVSETLRDPAERRRLGFPEDDDAPMPIMLEVNIQHADGPEGAVRRLRDLLARLELDPSCLRPLTGGLFAGRLAFVDIGRLVEADSAEPDRARRAIYRVWPDFPVRPLIDRSMQTVKADAAQRAYHASGTGMVWGVIDSGIDAEHLHFREHGNLTGSVAELHRDFTDRGRDGTGAPLFDALGHGSHVAGIIAGELPESCAPLAFERVTDSVTGAVTRQPRARIGRLSGVAPQCKLVSLKVLGDEGEGNTSNIIEAIRYVREVNATGKAMRIHGVNLSLGYEFDARWFACGQSPLCIEVDQLVRTGVVAVVAAGNTGYGRVASAARTTGTGLGLTINDPGNADLAITVGATHRDQPYSYGVSYFSSKGPTGDGRQKPDLVAPGERITSCATGAMRASTSADPGSHACYVDDDGTSMAAPHVSGAIAAFLSIRSEFVGRPERVKQLFVGSASSLGRSPEFQGAGLLDLMRTIESV